MSAEPPILLRWSRAFFVNSLSNSLPACTRRCGNHAHFRGESPGSRTWMEVQNGECGIRLCTSASQLTPPK
eukprot:6187748-Pleurochrysis_carterae.AAC.1